MFAAQVLDFVNKAKSTLFDQERINFYNLAVENENQRTQAEAAAVLHQKESEEAEKLMKIYKNNQLAFESEAERLDIEYNECLLQERKSNHNLVYKNLKMQSIQSPTRIEVIVKPNPPHDLMQYHPTGLKEVRAVSVLQGLQPDVKSNVIPVSQR